MIDVLLAILVQTAAGDPAPATEPAPQQTAEAPQAQSPQATPQLAQSNDTVRCRRERLSGSRVMQRVCTTAQQDAEMRSDARQMINRAQSQGRAD